MMRYTSLQSPVGPLFLAGDEAGLRVLSFSTSRRPRVPELGWVEDADFLRKPVMQLQEYFAGQRTSFDLSLAPEGTAFQKRVWAELRKVSYGETISYGGLARRIGNPNASRAVGGANGKNAIAIVIPCHRVIAADGSIGGFGGGTGLKQALLDLETGR